MLSAHIPVHSNSHSRFFIICDRCVAVRLIWVLRQSNQRTETTTEVNTLSYYFDRLIYSKAEKTSKTAQSGL